ncbi:Golgi Transport, partial [Cladochytrium tenue]
APALRFHRPLQPFLDPDIQSSPVRSSSFTNCIAGAHNTEEIGVGLTIAGISFMGLGVAMLFDGGLLAIGNILFLAGLFLVIGAQRTYAFFARREKLRGTACFFGGILLVFLKWPVIGMLVELFGFINLFGTCAEYARGLQGE